MKLKKIQSSTSGVQHVYMKIAFFNYLMLEFGGGVAKYFIEVSNGLKKRYPMLDITILNFNEKALRWILLMYAIYFFGKQDRSLINKEITKEVEKKLKGVSYLKIGSLRELKEKLQEYDFIYSTNNLLEVLLLENIIGLSNLPPVIFGFHIPSYYPKTASIQSKLHNFIYSSWLYRSALKKAKKLHVVNTYDEVFLSKYFPQKKVVKIYYPFDFARFEKINIRNKIQLTRNKGKVNLLWVGRLTEQKGVDDLITLIDRINTSRNIDSIEWKIAGEGELKEKIVNLTKKWSNVHYLGYIKNEIIGGIYKNSDLFISTSKWESFPYNILEAQSFGIPAIAYNIQGCNNIITNGKNGFLVTNVDQFQKKIFSFLDKNPFKKEAIKRYIRNKFNRELIFKKLYHLFTDD